MPNKILTIVFLCSLSLPAFGFRPGTDDSSTMHECLWNQAELGADQVECNDTFHQYFPASDRKKKQNTVRIGSYNILRTSEQKGKKDLDLTAQMIDSEWDLVSLQELQPGRTDEIEEFGKTGKYSLPAYLELFITLQELDPTWGMIVSPFSQGGDSELLGFLYRGSQVDPVESEYCKVNYLDSPPYKDSFVFREINKQGIASGNGEDPVNDRSYVVPAKALACPLKVSEMAANYFIKIPLTARFKIGNFESSFVSLHLSFRGIDEFDSSCMGLCQIQNLKLISTLDGDDDNPIANAINDLIKSDEFQSLVLGTEVKIPDPEDRCQLDPKDLKDDEDRERGQFANCLERLEDQIKLIEEHGFLPKSCASVVENIDNDRAYSQCQDDFEDLRDDAYKKFIKDFFAEEVFTSRRIKKIKKKSGQNMEEYLAEIFGESTATGVFNYLGRDHSISKGEGREFARFYQVYQVMKAAKEMRAMEATTDVMISGDFNLEKETELNRWEHHLWQGFLSLLGDAELYIDGLTSINTKRELSKNYDHFIFSPSETNECDPSTVAVFNFLTESLSNGFDLGAAVMDQDYHFVMSDHLPIGIQCATE